MKFDKYKNANITIEIQSMIPERFINLLWKNGVKVKNVVKTNVTTFVLDIDLKDYAVMDNIARRTGTKVTIVKRKGISFLILFLKRRFSLVIGIFIFSFIIYFMSTFIWDIDITSTNGVTPYEIRQQLKKYGIKPGINKNTIDVYKLEEKLIKDIDNIMWVKARIEGGKLVVKAEERQSPPTIVKEDEPCDLVAKKDGEVQRVYTTSGSAIVQNGDIVKKGDILIKGEQGKEGETYEVHSEGKVFARTFYEEIKTINTYRIKRKRTGKKIERTYINFKGKKLYLKKTINKFEKYDRIENNKLFITKETLYEVKETKENINLKKAIDEENEKIYKNITKNLDKSVKVVDKITNYSPEGESCKIRMLIIAEEDIAVPQKIEVTDKEEDS
ncbi:sporulation protein YqfD [Clostridium botulinum]|uniref:sporulation protein YqfD n=1 Tax=Clostridium botulinum TaxID=1491 RepID=UPI000464E07D|nr:sporulation protein YqfD [Clostridium botulinum]AJD26578.1 sporulation protein YqfD [Clostridium botulinum CDC_297]APR01499.1 sporulation protein YqfD [Clostridium botulinum]APU58208.1 sporulation protein YqfD [Clostridium botulinum]AUN04385.1 sporulation protein YqfD [Clostridium botulinum]MBN3396254.1 sporulation protein YqfD [Clostridium botulinum]